MKCALTGLEEQQIRGIRELLDGLDLTIAEDGYPIFFEQAGAGIEISASPSACHIRYASPHMVARCMGLFAEHIREGLSFTISETPAYDTLCVMLDCSRNAVLTVDSFKKITRKFALMGYSMIQLYTEDTYTMEEYPYFGYFRGRYKAEDFREMDRYCQIFGIELVPCIQTLAHLASALRWQAFDSVSDTKNILLVDEEKTYELIDCMFRTMSECLTSRRINIGLDEAHALGLGKFLDRHGFENRVSIMMRHCNRVMDIARKYGYRPMMWSDMFFRLVYGGDYYRFHQEVDTTIIDQMPQNMDLIYWDYYHDDETLLNGMMARHKQITEHTMFAGGVWKWSGFAPGSHLSEHLARVMHRCCVQNGIREMIVTAWGDNGAFCSTFAVLPAFQIWAELCYQNRGDEATLCRRFETCVGDRYRDFMALGLSVLAPDNPAPGKESVNPATYILWQDILCGLFDRHIDPESYRAYYERCSDIFDKKANEGGAWAYLFETLRAFCTLLSQKCGVGIALHAAYAAGDRDALRNMADAELPALRKKSRHFGRRNPSSGTEKIRRLGETASICGSGACSDGSRWRGIESPIICRARFPRSRSWRSRSCISPLSVRGGEPGGRMEQLDRECHSVGALLRRTDLLCKNVVFGAFFCEPCAINRKRFIFYENYSSFFCIFLVKSEREC